jgi:hypothetical protein
VDRENLLVVPERVKVKACTELMLFVCTAIFTIIISPQKNVYEGSTVVGRLK